MRSLDRWLEAVRADGLVIARTRVAGPWGFRVEAGADVVFHFVAEGRAFVRRPHEPPLLLSAGDLVMLPRGEAHQVAHSARGKAISLEEFLALRDGIVDRAALATTLLCGQFRIDRHLALPALSALPPIVRLRAASGPEATPLSDMLRLLRREIEAPNFGSEIVVRNLASSLFVYFMRDWAKSASTPRNDWFSAIRAPHLARVLGCIHDSPAKRWTLDSLANQAGLSRAAFARQFAAAVGEPPHSYLVRWRMGIAAQLLEETDLRLAEIAARVGYESEFSFARAFKRARGIAPIQFRRAVARARGATTRPA